MSRHGAPRALTLPEELEKLEQSITLTLQEIDSNFSTAHRIVTSTILPIVEQYAKHSSDVWEGSKFWKSFFEASANVSLSGYEEAALEDDLTHTDTTTTTTADDDDTVTEHDQSTVLGADAQAEGEDSEDDEFSVDSPTQVTGAQSTPRLPPSTVRRNQVENNGKATTSHRSPSPRKYTGRNPRAQPPRPSSSEEPSTPQLRANLNPTSSPFEPDSAFQPSGLGQQQHQRQPNPDPLMHRSVLDKNYRIQATPHTQQRHRPAKPPPSRTPAATATKRELWDASSPLSSPDIAAPQLRSDLFSPPNPSKGTRTPGISVLTPSAKTTRATSTGRQLFSPQDKTYASAKSGTNRASHIFDDDDDDDEDNSDEDLLADLSPPKTMQFHVPQSRLLQTPAREASRRIVEDLLMTAGADATDEGIDSGDEEGEGFREVMSPSVVRRAWEGEDDTF